MKTAKTYGLIEREQRRSYKTELGCDLKTAVEAWNQLHPADSKK